ncbi:hypothetical protein EG329_005539 [Mollisiaceae sp. DMI_Dod_QoI]|nr:hypothetical protein EG329_005539 [Helotiales sp. DMI_Dod_QoI]
MESSNLSGIYQCLPLPLTNSTRLLTLLPGESDSKIVCTLSVAAIPGVLKGTIDAVPIQLGEGTATSQDTTGIETADAEDLLKYEALSYVWGQEPHEYDHIELCGRTIKVTRNLFSALYHLRKPIDSRVLWVDALCINQVNEDDNMEKNAQVQMMGQIYANATSVLSWLRPSDDDSIEAFYIFIIILDSTPTVNWLIPATSGNLKEELVKVLSKIPEESLTAIARTFSHRLYWHRLWVVQEFVGANKVNLICRHQCLTPTDIQEMHRRLVKTFGNPELQRLRNALSGLLTMLSLFDGESPSKGERNFGKRLEQAFLSLSQPLKEERSLRYLLQATTEKQCREPADKPIKIDYGKAVL